MKKTTVSLCTLFSLSSFPFQVFVSLFLEVVNFLINGCVSVWSIHDPLLPSGPVDAAGLEFLLQGVFETFFGLLLVHFTCCRLEQKICLGRRLLDFRTR